MDHTTIVGHLGKDPEVRQTKNGSVANLSVAVYRGKNKSEWFPVVAWGANAEHATLLKKGDRVVVVGQMTTRKWQDKEGNDRYTTELVANEFFGVVAKAPKVKSKDAGDSEPDDGGKDDDYIPF